MAKVPNGLFGAGTTLGLLATLLVSGCATQSLPLKHVTEAQAAISAAEAVGADEVPKAQLHLKMARDQVDAAERYVNEKEPDRARMMLLRARADAEVALALCREDSARRKIDGAREKLETLVAEEPDDGSDAAEEDGDE